MNRIAWTYLFSKHRPWRISTRALRISDPRFFFELIELVTVQNTALIEVIFFEFF